MSRWQSAVIIGLMAAYSVLGHSALLAWESELTVWAQAVKVTPTKARPRKNLAKALYGAGREQEALAQFTIGMDLEEIENKCQPGCGTQQSR